MIYVLRTFGGVLLLSPPLQYINVTWITRNLYASWKTRDDLATWDTRNDLATWKTRA
jgi:hypothetical protein